MAHKFTTGNRGIHHKHKYFQTTNIAQVKREAANLRKILFSNIYSNTFYVFL